jgi:hypothetical protein
LTAASVLFLTLLSCGASHEAAPDGDVEASIDTGARIDAPLIPDASEDSSVDGMIADGGADRCETPPPADAAEPLRCRDIRTDCPATTPYCCFCDNSWEFGREYCLHTPTRACFECPVFGGCTERTPPPAIETDCLGLDGQPDSARCPSSQPICCRAGGTVICTDRIPYGWNCNT